MKRVDLRGSGDRRAAACGPVLPLANVRVGWSEGSGPGTTEVRLDAKRQRSRQGGGGASGRRPLFAVAGARDLMPCASGKELGSR
jgi:hypothetical protein